MRKLLVFLGCIYMLSVGAGCASLQRDIRAYQDAKNDPVLSERMDQVASEAQSVSQRVASAVPSLSSFEPLIVSLVGILASLWAGVYFGRRKISVRKLR